MQHSKAITGKAHEIDLHAGAEFHAINDAFAREGNVAGKAVSSVPLQPGAMPGSFNRNSAALKHAQTPDRSVVPAIAPDS